MKRLQALALTTPTITCLIHRLDPPVASQQARLSYVSSSVWRAITVSRLSIPRQRTLFRRQVEHRDNFVSCVAFMRKGNRRRRTPFMRRLITQGSTIGVNPPLWIAAKALSASASNTVRATCNQRCQNDFYVWRNCFRTLPTRLPAHGNGINDEGSNNNIYKIFRLLAKFLIF